MPKPNAGPCVNLTQNKKTILILKDRRGRFTNGMTLKSVQDKDASGITFTVVATKFVDGKTLIVSFTGNKPPIAAPAAPTPDCGDLIITLDTGTGIDWDMNPLPVDYVEDNT